MITEDQILDLKNEYIKNSGILENLCLVIHPSREQGLLDILNPYSPKQKTEKVSYHIKEIFGMSVYKDETCPPNGMYIIPEFEYLDFDE